MIVPLPGVEVAADNTVLPPAQNEATPEIVAVGFTLTVTGNEVGVVALQPLASE